MSVDLKAVLRAKYFLVQCCICRSERRGGSRNFIGGARGAEGAEVGRRRREDRGAAGAEGCGEGVSPPHRGRGLGRGLFFQYCIIKWPVLVDSDVLLYC